MTKNTVVRQYWLESERGWGIRPDGYSLHMNEIDRLAFIKEYWAGMPDEVPYEYSRPEGSPDFYDVDDIIYAAVKASKNGIRRYR